MQNQGEQKSNLNAISTDGKAFLKTATAAPDFEALELGGIPDGHCGPTVCVKQYTTETIEAPPGMATYVMLTPQFGISHWTTSVVSGADWINGQDLVKHTFPKANQIFNVITDPALVTEAGGSNTLQLSKGRLMASSGELECLNNAFNQYGSITSWKVPLQCDFTPEVSASTRNVRRTVNGIEGVARTIIGSQAYTAAVREGAYAVSMNREEEFDWTPFHDGETATSVHAAYFGDAGPAAIPGIRANFNGPIVGWDNNFDTIVFRIDVPAGVVAQSFLLKRWLSYEAQPVFNSLLWDTAHLSPERDETALKLYRELVRNLPMAVARRDNPDFWRTMLNIIDESSNILSFVPGPIGAVAKGLHSILGIMDARSKNRRGRATGRKAKRKPARKGKRK